MVFCDAIAETCHNFNGGLANRPLELWRGYLMTGSVLYAYDLYVNYFDAFLFCVFKLFFLERGQE